MLYEVPAWRRVIDVRKDKSIEGLAKIISIDGIGFVIIFESEENLKEKMDNNFVQEYSFREKVRCIIEAESLNDIFQKFFSSYKAARVGGSEENAKAMVIDREECILELPDCSLLKKSEDKYFCLDEKNEKNQNKCVIENLSPKKNCPIQIFYEAFHSFKREYLPYIRFKGFKFVNKKTLAY